MSRDLRTRRSQVFGDVEKGTECRVCGRNVDDGRRKTCSEYCNNLVEAVMGLLNWSSLRRQIIERDDETCQVCGYDRRWESKASDHIRALVNEYAGERPEGPHVSLDDPDSIRSVSDDEWDRYHERVEAWRQRLDEAKEKYGEPWGDRGRDLEVDHIQPIADGGHPFDPANLQTLCECCHGSKTARENSERDTTPSRGELSHELLEFVATNSGDST